MKKVISVVAISLALVSFLVISSVSVFADTFSVTLNFHDFNFASANSYLFNAEGKRIRVNEVNFSSTGGSSNLTVLFDTDVTNQYHREYNQGCIVSLQAPSLSYVASANNKLYVKVSVYSYFNDTFDVDLNNYKLTIREQTGSAHTLSFDCINFIPIGSASGSRFNYELIFESTVSLPFDFTFSRSSWSFSFLEDKGMVYTSTGGYYYTQYQYVFATCLFSSSLSDIQQQTEDLEHGWGTDDDTSGDVGNKSDDIGDLENSALGGKSSDDVTSDFSNTVDISVLDGGSASDISDFFNGLLNVFGLHYKSVLVLSLSLGMACFLIGRRYKTG